MGVFCWWISRSRRAESFPLKLQWHAEATKAREPSYNPRASSGAMPVGAISRSVFIPAKHGAVQSCGGVRGGAGRELPAVQLPVLRGRGEHLRPV